MDFFRNTAVGMDNWGFLNLIQLHTGPYLVPKYKHIRNGGMKIFRNAPFGLANESCFDISPNKDANSNQQSALNSSIRVRCLVLI